jgi:hypothetical protein
MKPDCPLFPVRAVFPPWLIAGAVSVFGSMLATGCASSYAVKVDSRSQPKAEQSISYHIVNKNPLVDEDSLRYQEATGFVRTALSGKGLYESPDPQKADLVLAVDYGIGPPVVKREMVSEPVYVTVPGTVSNQTVQVGTDKQGNPVYQTVMVQSPPTTLFTGYREYPIEYVVYEKFLKLSAQENKPATEGQSPATVWAVDVTSEGESRDVRKTLPVLAAATIDYIGKDSQGEKMIHLKDGSPDVAFVKKGM